MVVVMMSKDWDGQIEVHRKIKLTHKVLDVLGDNRGVHGRIRRENGRQGKEGRPLKT